MSEDFPSKDPRKIFAHVRHPCILPVSRFLRDCTTPTPLSPDAILGCQGNFRFPNRPRVAPLVPSRRGHGPNQVFRPCSRPFPIHLAGFRCLGVERKPKRDLCASPSLSLSPLRDFMRMRICWRGFEPGSDAEGMRFFSFPPFPQNRSLAFSSSFLCVMRRRMVPSCPQNLSFSLSLLLFSCRACIYWR